MMPDRARDEARVFWISVSAHAIVVLGFAVAPLIRARARPPKPREMVTYIDLPASMAVERSEVPDLRAPPPEPEPAPPPEPERAPPPRETSPSPARETPRPRPTTERPRPIPARSSKPTPRSPPSQTPSAPARGRPTLTSQQIREHLAHGLPSGAPAADDDVPFGWYFALVKRALYEAWIQPSGLSAASGLTVQARIRVERDGSISRREILRPSGHPAMDESVRRALDAVQRLAPLPPSYRGSYRDITIVFELTTSAA